MQDLLKITLIGLIFLSSQAFSKECYYGAEMTKFQFHYSKEDPGSEYEIEFRIGNHSVEWFDLYEATHAFDLDQDHKEIVNVEHKGIRGVDQARGIQILVHESDIMTASRLMHTVLTLPQISGFQYSKLSDDDHARLDHDFDEVTDHILKNNSLSVYLNIYRICRD